MAIMRYVNGQYLMIAVMLNAAVAYGQQDYPSKAIRVVAAEAGSSTDVVVRLVATALTKSLAQTVIVDNRATTIAPGIVSDANADGYNLLCLGTTFWIKPLLQELPYDPVRDFAPISLMASAANELVVSPSLPVKTVKELIALAKAEPGQLNYAGGDVGSSPHLAAELFKTMAGINIVHVPYKGPNAGLIDVIGGRVQIMFASAASVAQNIKAGKLRALAIGSLQPSALAPGIPTMAASGLPGYESATLVGMFAKIKTPSPIVTRLNQEIVKYLHQPGVRELFLSAGAEIVASTPEQLALTVKSETEKWGKLIKDAGIHVD